MRKTLKSRAFSKLQTAKNDAARKAYLTITEALHGNVPSRELCLDLAATQSLQRQMPIKKNFLLFSLPCSWMT